MKVTFPWIIVCLCMAALTVSAVPLVRRQSSSDSFNDANRHFHEAGDGITSALNGLIGFIAHSLFGLAEGVKGGVEKVGEAGHKIARGAKEFTHDVVYGTRENLGNSFVHIGEEIKPY
ncbi:hypothetical protein IWQ61_000808 [Dispira simplex]|nr:hypothetical protein IWQ61_000808 [Dispira simplex]